VFIASFVHLTYADNEGRLDPIPVQIKTPSSLKGTFEPFQIKSSPNENRSAGTCPSVSVNLSGSDFGDGQYIMQAGFAEGESLGATYYISPAQFPIKIDLIETIFATYQTTQQTTTHYAVTVWDGTPDEGIQVASFSSDDVLLPHLVMPAGTGGMHLSFAVDPDDPDQIYVNNDSGLNAYSVAFKVVQHNNPGNPCITSPPTNSNAFPCTDTDGLHHSSQNWIEAVTGTFCVCGSGWMTFLEFPALCTPSGDWVLRSSYTPVNCNIEPVACCFSDNTCFDLTPEECTILEGTYQSNGTSCATYVCGSGSGACCVEATGNCVEFDLSTCQIVGGIHHGEGTTCASTVCFPEGACCLPDGTCSGPVTDTDCVELSGTFQGDGTSCSTANCPQPTAACCGVDWCLDLTEADCSAVGGSWTDTDTACADQEVCTSSCPADLNADNVVNVTDLLQIVNDWGQTDSSSDIDGTGVVDTGDLLAVIAAWGQCG